MLVKDSVDSSLGRFDVARIPRTNVRHSQAATWSQDTQLVPRARQSRFCQEYCHIYA